MIIAKDFGCKEVIEVNNIIPSGDITLIELTNFKDFKKVVKKNSYVLKHGNTYYIFEGFTLHQWTNKDEKDEVSNY